LPPPSQSLILFLNPVPGRGSKRSFNVPDDYIFGAAMALGYQGDPAALTHSQMLSRETAPRERKPLSEFVLADWGVPARLG
jgi:hypothetical protein